MLLLLGAAGGTLRGLIDAYNCLLTWQAARRLHRQDPDAQEREVPRFADYFDPLADPIALVFHAGLGGAAAMLFGLTGQISGVYATVAVGASAPVILTQIARLQFVSQAVEGAPQPSGGGGQAGDQPTAEAAAPAPPPAAAPPAAPPAAPLPAARPPVQAVESHVEEQAPLGAERMARRSTSPAARSRAVPRDTAGDREEPLR